MEDELAAAVAEAGGDCLAVRRLVEGMETRAGESFPSDQRAEALNGG